MDFQFNGKSLVCQHCGNNVFVRIHRRGWEKFIPHSRLFRCEKCSATCLVLTGHEHLTSTKKLLRPVE